MNGPADWPEVAENIVIGPFGSDDARSKMGFASSPILPSMNQRIWDGQTTTRITPLPAQTPKPILVEGPVIYGGPLFHHFGHFIAESIHRLWPRTQITGLRRARIAYHAFRKSGPVPAFVAEILNMCGVSTSDLLLIDRFTAFERLIVPEQRRLMSGPTTPPAYRTTFEEYAVLTDTVRGGSRRLYVSRIDHHHSGSIHGESYLHRVLESLGFQVVVPEREGVHRMVGLLRAAECAVFAEGSAIHLLELCGLRAPNVFVIGRRPQSLKRFGRLLASVTDKWAVGEFIQANIGSSADPKHHSAVLDIEAAIRAIAAFCGIAAPAVDVDAYSRHVSRDLEK